MELDGIVIVIVMMMMRLTLAYWGGWMKVERRGDN